jgi:thiol-disulfide isomerase/thioredoxin
MRSLTITLSLAAFALTVSFKNTSNHKATGYTYILTDSASKAAAISNLSYTDQKGKQHTLIDATKKVNMVVFWASWCSPCRLEIPNLKDIYSKVDTTKLRLISISVDMNRADWVKAMKEEKMPWTQGWVVGNDHTNIKKQFGFNGIPQIYFLDPKGNILAGYTGYHFDNNVGLTALVKRMVEN